LPRHTHSAERDSTAHAETMLSMVILTSQAAPLVPAEQTTLSPEAALLQANALAHYTKYTSRGCSGKNELGTSYPKGGLSTCSALCDIDSACVSFEMSSSGKCQLSNSCQYSDSESSSSSWTLYVKNMQVGDGYTAKSGYGCTGKNELGTSYPKGGLHECKALCDSEDECVSFEFAVDGLYDSKCQLSTSCTASDATSNNGNWNIYFKTPPSPPPPTGPGAVCSPTCTTAVWNTIAKAKNGREHSCGSRIMYRVNKFSGDYAEACAHVARSFPDICGPCGA